jgi:hypothetical protein
MFSSSRAGFVVPGMGTIHGFGRAAPRSRSEQVSPFPFRDVSEQINKGQIGFPSLRREAWQDIAKVGAVERGASVDLAREKSLAERAIRDKADAEFLQCRQHFPFGPSRPQRVFALDCGDRLDCVCAADRLRACFGKAKVFYLAFPNQIFYRTRHVINGHFRVDPVLI